MNFKDKFNELKVRTSFDDDTELFNFFDELPPVKSEDILFPWKGGDFKTGHWCTDMLMEIKWFGKNFTSKLDNVPLLCYNDEGNLYSNKTLNNGESSLWDIEFRGKVSSTMVYDGVPIFDHFRKVDDNTLFGVMNGKKVPGKRDIIDSGRYYFFYLEKLKKLPVEFVET